MADGRQHHDWSVAASVMALIANCHRDPKTRAFKPKEFHPLLQKKHDGAILVTKETVHQFRQAFTGETS
ncbi:MAG: hypothetical protein JXQ75_03190 [Phycisphaerae bacterium]|nr:hypothetical protein [Phycisphaerae bacterium]